MKASVLVLKQKCYLRHWILAKDGVKTRQCGCMTVGHAKIRHKTLHHVHYRKTRDTRVLEPRRNRKPQRNVWRVCCVAQRQHL